MTWYRLGFLISALTIFTIGLVRPASAQNLVVNGSFENPKYSTLTNLPNGVTINAPFNIGGWQLDQNDVDLVGGVYQAAEGNQLLLLNGFNAGSVYQDINTIPGQTYLLRFAMAGDPGKPGFPLIKHMTVFWGAATVDSPTFDISNTSPANMGWTYHEYNVVAAATITRLRFTSLDNDPTGPGIDDVSVLAVSVAPEPGTLSLSLAIVLSGGLLYPCLIRPRRG